MCDYLPRILFCDTTDHACVAERLTKQAGQNIVAVNISWAQPDTSCKRYYALVECASSIVSFIGCVGSLMAESGLVDIMSGVFRGVDHMLTEKNFTRNFCAL